MAAQRHSSHPFANTCAPIRIQMFDLRFPSQQTADSFLDLHVHLVHKAARAPEQFRKEKTA